jgi:ABC-type polysaccharide/polyol phosphate export permease
MSAAPSVYGAAARSILAGFSTQLRESGLSPFAIAGTALAPVTYGVAVIAGFGRPTGALLLGAAAAGLWGSLYVQSAVIVVQERGQGTLQLLAASPVPLCAPLFGRLLATACQALAAIPVIVVIIVALFGGVRDVALSQLAVALAVTTIGLVGISMVLMGALARYRYAAGMVNGLFDTVLLVGGFFVPLAALPGGIRSAGMALPSSWSVAAVWPAAAHPWTDLRAGALLAVGWVAVGALYLAAAQRRLRKIGFYQN